MASSLRTKATRRLQEPDTKWLLLDHDFCPLGLGARFWETYSIFKTNHLVVIFREIYSLSIYF